MKTILLTGCAGFIGCNFLKKICCNFEIKNKYQFIVVDALTYAGNFLTIKNDIERNEHIKFYNLDIRNFQKLKELFDQYSFDGLINFAAESHVDRSIKNPNIFLETNVYGALNLLNCALRLFREKKDFRFVQISTDEVYGTLKDNDLSFTEKTPLAPNSPYSASKASADLFVRSYFETYQLPTLITRCSNNYGPYQFPEKFIPVMIERAKNHLPLPIYGKGENIRDWIYVDDHNEGVWKVFTSGVPGSVYNFGGNAEVKNIDLAIKILDYFHGKHSLINFVEDRLGHDYRYAMNFEKASRELNWYPKVSFNEGLMRTIQWYENNQEWMDSLKNRRFEDGSTQTAVL